MGKFWILADFTKFEGLTKNVKKWQFLPLLAQKHEKMTILASSRGNFRPPNRPIWSQKVKKSRLRIFNFSQFWSITAEKSSKNDKIDSFVKNRCGLGLRCPILSHAENPKKLNFGDFQVWLKSAKIALFGKMSLLDPTKPILFFETLWNLRFLMKFLLCKFL